MNELALFAGAGGGILGGKLLGWRTICAVEWEPYPAAILTQRQNEKVLESFPIWDDIQTFDGKPWNGIVDVVSGGFPCQDISSAGKGAGLDGDRSSMWYHMLRVIKEVDPEYAFIENSPHLRTKGLTVVLQGLAQAGYDAAWGVLSAEDCGANHERKRMWILAKRVQVANTDLYRESVSTINAKAQGLSGASGVCEEELPNTCMPGVKRWNRKQSSCKESRTLGLATTWWQTPPDLYRMDDGVAFGMDRLKAIGNGQVPIVAATAFSQLKKIVDNINKEVKCKD
jgi:DNA (cytosine-5)-methyltransferase 1